MLWVRRGAAPLALALLTACAGTPTGIRPAGFEVYGEVGDGRYPGMRREVRAGAAVHFEFTYPDDPVTGPAP